MRIGKPLMLAVFIILCELAGVLGSVFTINSIPTWYAGLAKPSFTPPSWLFGPVWIILYLIMGISAYLVYEKGAGKRNVRVALYVFGVQLALNAAWSMAFFGLRSIPLGLVVIIMLWIAIAATMVMFYRIRKSAAVLMLPYIAWVSIALALNYYVLILN